MLSKDTTNIKEQPLILSSSSDSEEDDLEQAIRIQNMNRYAAAGEQEGTVFAQTNPVALLDELESEVATDVLDPINAGAMDNLAPAGGAGGVDKSFQGDISWNSVHTTPHNASRQETRSHTSATSADDSIWNNVSVDYSGVCIMCQNYEKQLQLLQKDYMSVKGREQTEADNAKTIGVQLTSEKEHSASLEKSIETVAQDNRTQICIYEKNQMEVDRQVKILQEEFTDFQVNILKSMKSLIGEGAP